MGIPVIGCIVCRGGDAIHSSSRDRKADGITLGSSIVGSSLYEALHIPSACLAVDDCIVCTVFSIFCRTILVGDRACAEGCNASCRSIGGGTVCPASYCRLSGKGVRGLSDGHRGTAGKVGIVRLGYLIVNRTLGCNFGIGRGNCQIIVAIRLTISHGGTVGHVVKRDSVGIPVIGCIVCRSGDAIHSSSRDRKLNGITLSSGIIRSSLYEALHIPRTGLTVHNIGVCVVCTGGGGTILIYNLTKLYYASCRSIGGGTIRPAGYRRLSGKGVRGLADSYLNRRCADASIVVVSITRYLGPYVICSSVRTRRNGGSPSCIVNVWSTVRRSSYIIERATSSETFIDQCLGAARISWRQGRRSCDRGRELRLGHGDSGSVVTITEGCSLAARPLTAAIVSGGEAIGGRGSGRHRHIKNIGGRSGRNGDVSSSTTDDQLVDINSVRTISQREADDGLRQCKCGVGRGGIATFDRGHFGSRCQIEYARGFQSTRLRSIAIRSGLCAQIESLARGNASGCDVASHFRHLASCCFRG